MDWCDTSGNDELWLGVICSDNPVSAFEMLGDIDTTGTTDITCPAGMWAIWGFNLHFSTRDITCDNAASMCCQRTSSDRVCTPGTYDAWGETGLVNPAAECEGVACNHGGAEAQMLSVLCMCLPGHARIDPANATSGCTPCDLGQRPTAWRETCADCAAGTYCPRPDMDPLPCGSNATYCPQKSYEAIPVSPGFFSIGGNETSRTGQAPCAVRRSCSPPRIERGHVCGSPTRAPYPHHCSCLRLCVTPTGRHLLLWRRPVRVRGRDLLRRRGQPVRTVRRGLLVHGQRHVLHALRGRRVEP